MKKMRRILAVLTWMAAVMLLILACKDDVEVQQDYTFDLITLPVAKTVVQNKAVEIRCELVKEGDYADAKYFIRYFQPDGKGELRLEDGTKLLPNDLYPLPGDVFRLYYTSRCTDHQTIEVYVENSFGKVVQKTFSWQDEKGTGGDEFPGDITRP